MEAKMKLFNIFSVLIISTLVISSCSKEICTYRKMTYIVQGDSSKAVEFDSLLIIKDSIKLLAGKDTLEINGNIFQIYSSVITENDSIKRINLFLNLKDNKNKILTEINIAYSDTIKGFDYIQIKGDIAKLPKELYQAMKSINSYANATFQDLEKKGRKRVVDLVKGDEIKN